jgi:hypothetical protein
MATSEGGVSDGGPAFPVAGERWVDACDTNKGVTSLDGMTLRDALEEVIGEKQELESEVERLEAQVVELQP